MFDCRKPGIGKWKKRNRRLLPVRARVEFADLIEADVQVGRFTELVSLRHHPAENDAHNPCAVFFFFFFWVLLRVIKGACATPCWLQCWIPFMPGGSVPSRFDGKQFNGRTEGRTDGRTDVWEVSDIYFYLKVVGSRSYFLFFFCFGVGVRWGYVWRVSLDLIFDQKGKNVPVMNDEMKEKTKEW